MNLVMRSPVRSSVRPRMGRMLAGLALAAGLAFAGCSDPKNDVTKFDDAKLERLASAGDKAAMAERQKRTDKEDVTKAADKAKSDAAQAAKDAADNETNRKAYDAALAAHDEAKISELADAGNAAALYHRGEARLKSDDQVEKGWGYADIETAANKGDADALLWVGFRRSQGTDGYPWNPATGRDMVERAANAGSRDAMYAAGQIYDYAGPLHDVEKAKAWYQKAADKGLDAAKSRLDALKATAEDAKEP